MQTRMILVVVALAGTAIVANCSTEESAGTGGSGTGANGTGGNGTGNGGNGTGGNGTGGNGSAGNNTGGNNTGGAPPCVVTPCAGHTYQCGDCEDNDLDGLADSQDPDCLGPCSNNEAGFDLKIPGGANPPCQLDCYYDASSGSGNDDCYWDHRCDPLEPSLVPDGCTCNPDGQGGCIPPPSADCPDPQSNTCHNICGPLTPNGCDCFGCCELPAESGHFVYIGTKDTNNVGTCKLGDENNATLCHPCTPVGDCLNPCGHCELCLGKTELPPDCYQGTGGSGGTGGAGGSGGAPQECGPTSQPCGLPGQPACPAGQYCITGCCQMIN